MPRLVYRMHNCNTETPAEKPHRDASYLTILQIQQKRPVDVRNGLRANYSASLNGKSMSKERSRLLWYDGIANCSGTCVFGMIWHLRPCHGFRATRARAKTLGNGADQSRQGTTPASSF